MEWWNIPVDDPILLAVAEPRKLEMTLGDALWLRIVDLPSALAGRRYRGDGRVVLEVEDEFCPWNDGRWSLTVEAGVPLVEPTTDSPDIACDVTDVAAAYLGAFSFARAGGRGSRLGAVARRHRARRRALPHGSRAVVPAGLLTPSLSRSWPAGLLIALPPRVADPDRVGRRADKDEAGGDQHRQVERIGRCLAGGIGQGRIRPLRRARQGLDLAPHLRVVDVEAGDQRGERRVEAGRDGDEEHRADER